ncbi:MAG: hypothetical protein ACI39U_04030, partial [Candidatus Cryptobacteroides sp.]
MYVGYKGLKGNDTEHVFQLVFEPQTEKSNEYFFYLYHNAGEDKCAEDTPEENIEEKGGYISFRVEHIISGLTFDSSTKFWIYPASDKESGESSTEVSAAACRQGF